MSLDAIVLAIETQLSTIAGIAAADIAYMNVVYAPNASKPYLVTSMPALTRDALTLGDNYMANWRGTYQVDCNYPVRSGIAPALQMVQKVLQLFPRGLSLALPGGGLTVRFDNPRPIPPVPAAGSPWNRASAQMPWFSLEIIANA